MVSQSTDTRSSPYERSRWASLRYLLFIKIIGIHHGRGDAVTSVLCLASLAHHWRARTIGKALLSPWKTVLKTIGKYQNDPP